MSQPVEPIPSQPRKCDILTGLSDRQFFNRRLSLELSTLSADRQLLAIFAIDLDRFKKINELVGYQGGDRLLRSSARRLSETVGDSAIIARWNGDEFAIAIPQLQSVEEVLAIADRLLACFDLPFNCDRHLQILGTDLVYIKAHMGIAIATEPLSLDEILQAVDTALARAKQKGHNRYEIYSDPLPAGSCKASDLPNQQRLQLERMLHRVNVALADCQSEADFLVLHYQPQIDVATQKIIGVESLLRCQDCESRLISPAEFIPLAEASGSIVPMGEWVLKTACWQNRQWQERGLGKFSIAVNFSVKQLQSQHLLDRIERILAETKLEPHYLEIEITESIAIDNLDAAIATLTALRAIGVKISLDDFGTGYSSLSTLKYLPLDRLKIDRSFVSQLPKAIDAKIVETIVKLGRDLDLEVIAEGVETIEQFEFLRSINCDIVQGYLFARPLSASEFERLPILQG